jgi:omega-6 fatty acid desaturase (delta-12 desaturase)
LNSLTGIACSYVTLTPYEYWRTNHAIHHAHNGDLNYRGTGDIYTLTLEEYRAKSRWGRLLYRIYRNPFFLFFIGGPLMFLVLYRTPIAYRHARTRQGKASVIRNDIFIALTMLICYFTIGLDSLLLIYLPIIVFSASVGVFMFYVQHQFEDAYWSKAPEWTYDEAALKGSSYFRLPKIFQWFTGNIGLHHIHHLSPLIPNYELQRCHDENPEFQDVPTLTIRDSLRIIFSQIAIWDEEQERLINFRQAHQRLNEIEGRA